MALWRRVALPGARLTGKPICPHGDQGASLKPSASAQPRYFSPGTLQSASSRPQWLVVHPGPNK
jgi:hypothetical protein